MYYIYNGSLDLFCLTFSPKLTSPCGGAKQNFKICSLRDATTGKHLLIYIDQVFISFIRF